MSAIRKPSRQRQWQIDRKSEGRCVQCAAKHDSGYVQCPPAEPNSGNSGTQPWPASPCALPSGRRSALAGAHIAIR